MEDARAKSLIVRYLTNEATEVEQEELLEWVSMKDDNQQLFAQYVAVWESKLKYTAAFNLPFAQQKLNYEVDQLQREERNSGSFRLLTKMAAAIAVVVVLSAVVYLVTGTHSKPVAMLTKQAKYGERILVVLPDGTRVKLNSGAALVYPETFSEIREVSLQGEAFFDVSHNPAKPFVVVTGELHTKVVGTSFNVRQSSSQVAVTVATGRVDVTHNKKSQRLLANQKAIFNSATKSLKRSEADLGKELAWNNNTLVFDDVSLQDVARELEKWFGVSCTFSSEANKRCTLSATYANQSLNSILNSINFSTGTKVIVKGNQIVFSGTGCQ
jgi:transmembrane sensor